MTPLEVEPRVEIHPGRGPYLLMVHGMLSSRAQWRPNLEALAGVARPVVIELLGHGRSPSPDAPEPYRPDAYVRFFERLRERLGVERWIALGQSLGAALTLRYALDHPERVAAQLLTNSTSAFADTVWAEGIRPSMQRFAESLAAGGRAALEEMPLHPRNARRIAPDVHAALLADAELHDPAGVARTATDTVPHSPLAHRLGENRVPSLLLCGVREKRFEAPRRRAERDMPALEVAEIDAGHAVNLQDVQGFNARATAFLARHAAGV